MQEIQSPFLRRLAEACRRTPKVLALPESDDIRVLKAAYLLLDLGCIRELVLWGPPEPLITQDLEGGRSLAQFRDRIKWTITQNDEIKTATAQHLTAQLQKRGKSWAPHDLEEVSRHPLDQAAYLLHCGNTDAVVAGCVHTTADVIRAALRGVGLAPNCKTISSSFAMIRENEKKAPEQYIFADCGVIIEATEDQLLDIAWASVQTFRSLFPDINPRVAFLSFSTRGSAKHPAAAKMQRALHLFQKAHPDIESDGEFQFDAAYDPDVGARKAPGSTVAGQANCFIFPNLDAGNIAYKIAQRLGGFSAYGPILQGTSKPYTDLSRGATVIDIFASSLIALLQA